jgi:hypothetical protein
MKLWLIMALFQVSMIRSYKFGISTSAFSRARFPNTLRATAAEFHSSSTVSAPITRHRRYLDVPFDEKDEAKRLGAKWDSNSKLWYLSEFQRVGGAQKWKPDFLEVPYDAKDEAKALGARWNSGLYKWYVPKGLDLSLFSKWLVPAAPETKASEVLLLDLATSGLPTKTDQDLPAYTDLVAYNSSRVVRISALLCDRATLREVASLDVFVSEGVEALNSASGRVPEALVAASSTASSVPFTTAAAELSKLLAASPLILAHAAEFDISVLKSELHRHGLNSTVHQLESSETLCTMLLTTEQIGKVNGNGNPKYPSLREFYQYALPDDPEVHLEVPEEGGGSGGGTGPAFEFSMYHKALKSLLDRQAIEL